MMRLLTGLIAVCLLAAGFHPSVDAQTHSTAAVHASLVSTSPVSLAGEADSNSPAIWERIAGRWTLFVMTSVGGSPSLTFGRSLATLRTPNPVAFAADHPSGVWMESVIRDVDGTWYGYYHQEQLVPICNQPRKTVPRLGAARSENRGRTWEDLGPVLEAPNETILCNTRNHYFLGGVGDFTVLLDHGSAFVYFFYTQYIERAGGVGVSMARMAWSERDDPAGKITVWNDGVWLPASGIPVPSLEAGADEEEHPGVTWEYPTATPRFVARDRWDNGNSSVDVFWGPAVHWNTHLNQYVMLLNRASSNEWKQEGIYISYNASIDNPRGWSEPVKLFNGGRWYPQVLGHDFANGTDKQAGETARFYMSGHSDHVIRFAR
jgi:hypothetical protein